MTNAQKLALEKENISDEMDLVSGRLQADKYDSVEARDADTATYRTLTSRRSAISSLKTAETPDAETLDGHPKRLVEMREYVESGYYDRPLSGAAKEFNSELGLNDDLGTVPIELILPWLADEHRLDVNTPAPSEITENQGSIQQPVRAPSLLRDLNIATPRVPVGQQSYPRLVTDPTVALVAEGDAQEATAAAFSVSALSPIRLTGAISWSVEDAASFRGMSDAIQTALQAVLE